MHASMHSCLRAYMHTCIRKYIDTYMSCFQFQRCHPINMTRTVELTLYLSVLLNISPLISSIDLPSDRVLSIAVLARGATVISSTSTILSNKPVPEVLPIGLDPQFNDS